MDCVEVRGTLDRVRDSKNIALALRGDVRALVRAVQAGRFDG